MIEALECGMADSLYDVSQFVRTFVMMCKHYLPLPDIEPHANNKFVTSLPSGCWQIIFFESGPKFSQLLGRSFRQMVHLYETYAEKQRGPFFCNSSDIIYWDALVETLIVRVKNCH